MIPQKISDSFNVLTILDSLRTDITLTGIKHSSTLVVICPRAHRAVENVIMEFKVTLMPTETLDVSWGHWKKEVEK